MTKILHLVHQNYFRDPRVKRYVSTLAKSGVKADVVCVRDQGQTDIEPGTQARVYTIPLSRTYGGKQSYFIEYGIAFIFYFVWVTWLYLRNRYRLIHVHNMPDFLVFTAFLPRLFGAKIVLDIHDPTPEFYMSKFDSEDSIMVRAMRFQEKHSTRFVHAVITANTNFKNNLIERGVPEDKLTVVVNMPDIAIFDRQTWAQEKKAGENFSLLYPGTVAKRYGLEIVVRSIPLLIKEIPEIKLLIVGKDTQFSDELRSLATELEISSYVDIPGPVESELVPKLMASSDLGIYPALSDPHMDIAIPSKVLEFAVMGLPIVASRLPIIEQLFPDGGIIYSYPGDVEDFAKGVLEFFHADSLGMEMIKTVDRTIASRGGWQQEGAIYLDLVESLSP